MTKKLKRFRVNAVVKINFPIYVVAEDEDEAISKCEEKLDENCNLETYSDTIGLSLPYDEYDDDDETRVFEAEDYEIEPWSDFDFSIDEYYETEDVDLEYTDEEDEDDESGEDED